MFQIKVVGKIKTHISSSIAFLRKSRCLWDNVEKYGRVWKATDDNIIWHMCNACWITKATNIHTQNMKYFLLFRDNNACTNRLQCYTYTCIFCLIIISFYLYVTIFLSELSYCSNINTSALFSPHEGLQIMSSTPTQSPLPPKCS